MNKTNMYASLEGHGVRVEFNMAGPLVNETAFISANAIKGFWSTPSLKTEITEAQTFNGAHTNVHRPLYSARVVSIPFALHGRSRVELDELKTNLHRLVGYSDIVFTVYTNNDGQYVTGTVEIEYDLDTDEKNATGTINLTCTDACRYGVTERKGWIGLGGTSAGGLNFGPDGNGLIFPLNFGEIRPGVDSTAVLSNQGSYLADTRIHVNGDLNSVTFQWIDSEGRTGAVGYNGFVSWANHLVFNSRSGTATLNGMDVSSSLTDRAFPRIPAGGDVRITMTTTVNEWSSDPHALISYHDTWI